MNGMGGRSGGNERKKTPLQPSRSFGVGDDTQDTTLSYVQAIVVDDVYPSYRGVSLCGRLAVVRDGTVIIVYLYPSSLVHTALVIGYAYRCPGDPNRATFT